MQVSFFFDPICPWCWETARWLIEARSHRPIEIDWRPFSLDIKNEGASPSERGKRMQLEGRRALRVAEYVRAKSGPSAVENLYVEMARRWHLEGERTFDLASIVEAVGLESLAPGVADDSDWDVPVEVAMAEAMTVVGEDVGVPIVVFEGTDPVGFYGPIMAPAPRGEEAAHLFDHLMVLARTPGFFELKRQRDAPPRLRGAP
ncbi:MAG: DsbA family protein [Acidimicrobiia bacterium]|nr:DsbA family protein [Acidimicrobiia bacterium]